MGNMVVVVVVEYKLLPFKCKDLRIELSHPLALREGIK